MLHACAARFDMMENLEKFLVFRVNQTQCIVSWHISYQDYKLGNESYEFHGDKTPLSSDETPTHKQNFWLGRIIKWRSFIIWEKFHPYEIFVARLPSL